MSTCHYSSPSPAPGKRRNKTPLNHLGEQTLSRGASNRQQVGTAWTWLEKSENKEEPDQKYIKFVGVIYTPHNTSGRSFHFPVP